MIWRGSRKCYTQLSALKSPSSCRAPGIELARIPAISRPNEAARQEFACPERTEHAHSHNNFQNATYLQASLDSIKLSEEFSG
jgi:hypothetical protein